MKEEYAILSHLRQNSRKNLTAISKNTGIPVSTIFDRIKKYESSIIRKHTSLIDFGKLGYDVQVQLLIKVKPDKRMDVQEHLMKSHLVNSVHKINNGFDFIVEMLFKSMNQYHEFNEDLEKMGLQKKHEFFVLKELKRECFMNDHRIIDIMQ